MTISDITQIVTYPVFRKDDVLKDAIFEEGILGQPKFFAGGLAIVFPVTVQDKNLAYRCWYVDLGDLKDRYKTVHDYLGTHDTSYIVKSSYNLKGLIVDGKLWPTMIMDWVAGEVLIDWIAANYNNRRELKQIGQKLLELFRWMHLNKISHGDLQTDNIMVRPDGSVVLIDYDTICVPKLVGTKDILAGKRGFQHPSRFEKASKATLKADYFSELILYSGILALAENPKLYIDSKVGPGNDFFIIPNKDFVDINQSAAFKAIEGLSSECKILMQILQEYLSAHTVEDLIPFYERVEALSQPPTIKQLHLSSQSVLLGQSVTLSWDVQDTENLHLNYGAGSVTGQSNVVLTPTQSGYIELTASNSYGSIVQKVWVDVKPLPVIRQFKFEQDQIKYGSSTNLVWHVENASEVTITQGTSVSSHSTSGSLTVSPSSHEVFTIVAKGLDDQTQINREIEIQVFKPVSILHYGLDRYITLETVPASLQWQVNEATEVTIRTPNEKWEVANMGSRDVSPRKTTRFTIEARNPLFNVQESCELIVDELPRIYLALPPLTEKGMPLIPKINLGENQFKELLDSDFMFADIASTKERAGLGSIVKRLLNRRKK